MLLAYWFLHPLSSNGEGFWGGIGGDVTIFSAFFFGALGWWHQHNCHEHRCWRLQWHTHPDHGHPVCKVHHPHGGQPLPTTSENS